MRIISNAGVGAGAAVPFNNEAGRERVVVAWGTVTAADLEISPDGGTTWIIVQTLDGGGVFLVPIGGKDNYQVRVSVATGSGVYVDILD